MHTPTTRLTYLLLAGGGAMLLAALAREFVDPALISLNLYLLASTLFVTDGIDVIVRLLARRGAQRLPAERATAPAARLAEQAAGEVTQPYALIMSVYNLSPDAPQVLRALAHHKANTWIVDDCSTDATVLHLKQAGWRCLAAPKNLKKPGALKLLLSRLPAEIRTVVVLDPDVVILDSGRFPDSDLETTIRAFQRSGAAALCPRIRVRPDGLLANLQVIEYAFAFDLGRRSLNPASITSGIAIYDRGKLEQVLGKHSLAVYAEDLENAILLLGAGEAIYYDDRLQVQTEGQRRVRGWFSQRVGWAFGLLKVYLERPAHIARAARRSAMALYQYGIYLGVLSIALYPLKLVSLLLLALSAGNALDNLLGLSLIPDSELTSPVYFAAVYLKYTLLIATCTLISRPRLSADRYLLAVPLFFFYALAHLIPTGVGYLNWLTLRLAGRRVFDDHYDAAPRLNGAPNQGATR